MHELRKARGVTGALRLCRTMDGELWGAARLGPHLVGTCGGFSWCGLMWVCVTLGLQGVILMTTLGQHDTRLRFVRSSNGSRARLMRCDMSRGMQGGRMGARIDLFEVWELREG